VNAFKLNVYKQIEQDPEPDLCSKSIRFPDAKQMDRSPDYCSTVQATILNYVSGRDLPGVSVREP
jgi:hypothetical protein